MEPDKAGKAFQLDLHHRDGIVHYNRDGTVYCVLHQSR